MRYEQAYSFLIENWRPDSQVILPTTTWITQKRDRRG